MSLAHYLTLVLHNIHNAYMRKEADYSALQRQRYQAKDISPANVLEALYNRYEPLISATKVENLKNGLELSTCFYSESDTPEIVSKFKARSRALATHFTAFDDPSVAAIFLMNWMEEVMFYILGGVEEIPAFLNQMRRVCV